MAAAQTGRRIPVEFLDSPRGPPHLGRSIVRIIGQQLFCSRLGLHISVAVQFVSLKDMILSIENVAPIVDHGVPVVVVARVLIMLTRFIKI
jgi:hypothetical protein